MTKKHFEAIAATIKAQRDALASEDDPSFFPDGAAYDAVLATAAALATTFERFNSQFDRRRFLTACGF